MTFSILIEYCYAVSVMLIVILRNVTYNHPFMLSVVRLNVIMLSVVVPLK
jgi:hypothetical protein